MCGLITVLNTGKSATSANNAALMQFEDQRKRGVEGFGIIRIDTKKNVSIDRATEPYKFMWDIHHNPSNMIMVHHRTPTSTDNLISQTHPIMVRNGSFACDYLVMHNGVINNDKEMKKVHEDLGFIYTTQLKPVVYAEKYYGEATFNDSETFAIELARFIEGQIKEVTLDGSSAFTILQLDKKTGRAKQLYFGRSETASLKMAKTRNRLFLSSEGPGNEIKEDVLYSCELDEEMSLHRQPVKFDSVTPLETTITTYSSPADYASHCLSHRALTTSEKEGKKELGFSYGGMSRYNDEPFKSDPFGEMFEEEVVTLLDESREEMTDTIEQFLNNLEFDRVLDNGVIESYAETITGIMQETQRKVYKMQMDKANAEKVG